LLLLPLQEESGNTSGGSNELQVSDELASGSSDNGRAGGLRGRRRNTSRVASRDNGSPSSNGGSTGRVDGGGDAANGAVRHAGRA